LQGDLKGRRATGPWAVPRVQTREGEAGGRSWGQMCLCGYHSRESRAFLASPTRLQEKQKKRSKQRLLL